METESALRERYEKLSAEEKEAFVVNNIRRSLDRSEPLRESVKSIEKEFGEIGLTDEQVIRVATIVANYIAIQVPAFIKNSTDAGMTALALSTVFMAISMRVKLSEPIELAD